MFCKGECTLGIEERGEQQPTETEPDKDEPYDPEHLQDVVVTLLDERHRRVYMREIVYALTLSNKVSRDVYDEIRGELKTMKKSGLIWQRGKATFMTVNAKPMQKKNHKK